MNSAARHFDVDVSTIKIIFNTGISNDKYIYIFELRDNRVWVYDYDHKLIKILSNILKTSELYKIPYTTISRYIKSGKLYKNKYYFYNINSNNNHYFNK